MAWQNFESRKFFKSEIIKAKDRNLCSWEDTAVPPSSRIVQHDLFSVQSENSLGNA